MEGNPVAVACADVIAFLRGEGIYEHEAAHMRDLNNHGEHREVLELAERYGNCMAFLDHMALTHKLSAAWNAVCDKLNLEKKQVVRKLRVLEADKNADPETVEHYRAKREKLNKDLALVNLTCMRMEKLKEIPVDYDMEFPDELLLPEADRALLLDLDKDDDDDDEQPAASQDDGKQQGPQTRQQQQHLHQQQAGSMSRPGTAATSLSSSAAENPLQIDIPAVDSRTPE